MKRNGDFVEQAVLRHQKIILSVDHGVPKDVVEDGRRDETRAVDHPLFSQGFSMTRVTRVWLTAVSAR